MQLKQPQYTMHRQFHKLIEPCRDLGNTNLGTVKFDKLKKSIQLLLRNYMDQRVENCSMTTVNSFPLLASKPHQWTPEAVRPLPDPQQIYQSKGRQKTKKHCYTSVRKF